MRTCVLSECGRSFLRGTTGFAWHCSQSCYNRAYYLRHKASALSAEGQARSIKRCAAYGERLAARKDRACELCGAVIPGRLSLQRRFCSDSCCAAASYRRRFPQSPPRECALPECDAMFTSPKTDQRCCSPQHNRKLYNSEHVAEQKAAREPWGDKRRDAYHRRKALKKGATTGKPVHRDLIAKRDGYQCGLCHLKVNMALVWPHPKSPSLDHITPLTKGGMHDPLNVQLAHLVCNTAKGNRGEGEQPLLIG